MVAFASAIAKLEIPVKLFHSPASPYVRKVLVCAIERGLFDRIEIVAAAASPINPDKSIKAHNPTGKIPTLVTDDGMAIYDSRVICEYLDSLGRAPKLFPARGAERWAALVLQALADEVLTAAVNNRYENVLRPAEKRWSEWSAGQLGKITGALDKLDALHIKHLGAHRNIGTIAVACMLGYLDFRYADLDWRTGHPKLAAWYAKASKRPAMKATVPKG
jgi:glutathione S-transferase